MSRTGYVITYAGCSVLWYSKLQTEISLSTKKAEYIAVIKAMRKVIPFMVLMKEAYFISGIHPPNTEVLLKYSKTIKVVFLLQNLTNYCQEHNILLLTVIISEDPYKRRLSGYVTLIRKNKGQKFSLNQSTKHYSYI